MLLFQKVFQRIISKASVEEVHSAPTCHLHYLHIITFSAHLHSHSFSVYLHSHSFSIYSHLRTKSTHLNCPNCLLRHILTLTLSQQIYTLILEWMTKKETKIHLGLGAFSPWKNLSLIYTVHIASKILSCNPPPPCIELQFLLYWNQTFWTTDK